MAEDRKKPEQNFAAVEFQNFATDYHTWGCPVFVLDPPLKGGPIGLPKWEPRARNGLYIGHLILHAGSLALLLNIRTGHVSPQYHAVFDNTFSNVEHMRKGLIPGNWENLVEEHSELSAQEISFLPKSGILTNPQACPYLWRPGKKTYWIQFPKICL